MNDPFSPNIDPFDPSNDPLFHAAYVPSKHGYPFGYKPKGIVVQTYIIRDLFPKIGYCDRGLFVRILKQQEKLPVGAENWFAIPNWKLLASTYQEAVELVMDALSKQYGDRVTPLRSVGLGSQRLRETLKKSRAMAVLQKQQDADILFIPAQFGIRHRGRCSLGARSVMRDDEFALGIYEVGIMLLTHIDRLKNPTDLFIDGAGDDLALTPFGYFRRAPHFELHQGKLKFGSHVASFAYEEYGLASAFFTPPPGHNRPSSFSGSFGEPQEHYDE